MKPVIEQIDDLEARIVKLEQKVRRIEWELNER